MEILGIGRPAAPTRRAAVRRGVAFNVAEPAQATPEAGAAPVGVASLAGLLAMQEAGDPAGADAVRDRAARAHGHAVLDDLAALQRQVLRGNPDPALLRRLAERSGAPADAAAPGLRAVLAEIRLRARVELARYGVV